jgi:hypothetical protein
MSVTIVTICNYLGSNPDIPQKKKIINGRHKQRSGRHTLARQKNIQKKKNYRHREREHVLIHISSDTRT